MTQAAPLTVRMLGAAQLDWQGTAVSVPSRKSLVLMCLLAMQEAPLSRQETADLLWDGGLGNVRQALYQLRRLPGADQWLSRSEELAIAVQTDVSRLEAYVAEGDFAAAIGLWRGPFLDGLNVEDCPEVQVRFEDEARRVEALYRVALTSQASELERSADLAGALAVTEKLFRLDPFDEASVQRAMRLEFMLDRSETALLRYQNWARDLEAELGAEPAEETVQLAASIREGKLPQGSGFDMVPVRLHQLLGAIHVSRGQLGIDELASALHRDAFEVSEGIETLRRIGLLDGLELVDHGGKFRLTPSDTLLLERRVAEVLESTGVTGWQAEASLGHHWLRAGVGTRAAPWLLRAARGAFLGNSLPEAKELAFRASWTGTSQERFDALMLLESVCERNGDDSLRVAALGEAGELAWEMQDDRALCRTEMARARLYTRSKNGELALQHAGEALSIARRSGDRDLLALAWNGMGSTRFAMGDMDGALEAFHFCAQLDVSSESMRALTNMGAIHGMREEHDRAYDLFERALTLARRAGELQTVSACLNNLAASAERMGVYSQALKHLHESRQVARRLAHRGLEAQIIHNLAVIYTKQGAYGPAWNTTQEVLEESEITGDEALKAQGILQAAEVASRARAGDRRNELLAQAGQLLEQVGDQRRLVSYRAVLAVLAGPHHEIPAEVTQVAEIGLTSMYNWLLLELAQDTDDPVACEAFLQGVSWQGPHQEFVADLARLRALLLSREEPDSSGTGELTARLAAQVKQQVEYAEVPKACHLLALAAAQPAEAGEWTRRRDEALAEQARGLPAALRDSLLATPESWLTSVEQSQG